MKNITADKVRPAARRGAWGAGIAIGAISVLCSTSAPAQLVQPFTRGNLVVERLGTGGGSLSGNGNPIFFDEMTTNGTLVQSIAIPTNGTTALIDGNSSANGNMTLSADGKSIVFPGGVTNLSNTFGLTSATTAQVPRGVGQLNGNGSYSLVITSSVAYSGGSLRGAATDGQGNYWGSGTATTIGGIYYLGTASASNDVYSANLRCCGLFNGNLWYSTGSGTPGIGLWEFSGTPITNPGGNANAATKILTPPGTSPYNFSVSPDGNTIFVADDAAGISKYTQSGTFSLAYTLNAAPCYGLMVDWSTTPATVYATTGSGSVSNFVIRIVDNGANSPAVTNLTAGANKMFRMLSFAPTNSALVASAPLINGINPSSQTVGVGGTATISLSGFTGSPIASNTWYKIAGTVTNSVAKQSSGILTITNAQIGDSASYFAVVSNASGSVTSSVVTVTVQNVAPTITGITPVAFTNAGGSPAAFTVAATGTTPFTYYWFKEISGVGGSTNLIPAATTATLAFPATALTDTAAYQVIVSNAIAPFTATSAVVSLVVTTAPPVITGIAPASLTVNAGLNATFTVTNTGTPPLTYFWYKEYPGVGGSTNLIATLTNATLTLSGVLGGNAANYQVVITNLSSAGVTSAVVSLTVTNDPHIATQPGNTYGLVQGVAQFTVGVVGTTPTYQWYYSDLAGNIIAPVTDGTLPSGSIISGSLSSTLNWSNLQASDLTNFVVVVTTPYGTATSQVASLLSVSNVNVLAFWDFNGPEFTNTFNNPTCLLNPTPYIGVGTASVFGTALVPGTSPFSGSVDANNGNGFEAYPTGAYPPGYPPHAPPFSWGTSTYPTNGNLANNKTTGVQYNVSTVGAKNIKFSYEARTSATASRYYRLQYTTNQTDWVDYPSSTTFGIASVTYLPFSYDLTGITGVENNPFFGVRIVSEFESTANYGANTTNSYVGVSNNYGQTGTCTYDLVTFTGDAITNNNAAPTISGFTNVTMVDYIPYTNTFTVDDDTTPAGSLAVSAVSLDPASFNPTFEFGGSGSTRTLIIHPNSIAQTFAAAPILVTVTDGNGDSTVAWFTASVGTINLPPTNSLASLPSTNLLANTSITIPFSVGDDRSAVSALTYAVSSGNSTLIPNDPVNNLKINGAGTATPSLTIIPAANQLGEGSVTVTVYDNDPLAPKSTAVTFPVMVRPNTNIVAIDYFNYDASGSLDVVSAGYWKQISGGFGQTHVNAGVVTLDSADNTENLQALLLGAPYSTNSANVLYASYVVNMNPGSLPLLNGSYFAIFNDASGNTANVEEAVVAATNGAAPGYYRLGINNRSGAGGTNSQMFALDLLPGSNYVVVTSLIVSSGVSTLWVDPSTQSSPSVTDTSALTTKFNIGAFEFRTSGATAGSLGVSLLKVGTSFDSVFPALHAVQIGTNVVLQSSDGTIDLEATPDLTLPFTDVGATTPYTNSIGANKALFFRFKQ